MTDFEEAQDLAHNDGKFRALLRRARDVISLCEMLRDEYDLDLTIEEAADLFDVVTV